MLASGLNYEFGSLEESLTSLAIERQAEIEYIKVLTVVNAITQVGNGIRAAVAGEAFNGSEALKESLEGLKALMLPHLAEDKEKKAEAVKKKLIEETSRGPLQIKIMERQKDRRRRKG